jgi:gp16 family phage-associated protein
MAAPLRTREQVNQWFDATGTPIAVWARAHGFAPPVVYALLNGRTRGRRGTAHQAAVALGLKHGSPEDIGSPREEPIMTP